MHHTLSFRVQELLSHVEGLVAKKRRFSGPVSDQFSIVSILAEFHFGIAKDNSLHLSDLCALLRERHPDECAKLFISIAVDWFERGLIDAAHFFLQQSMKATHPPLPFVKIRKMLRAQIRVLRAK